MISFLSLFIVFSPLLGALFLLFASESSQKSRQTIKYVALFVTSVNFFISIYLWLSFDKSIFENQLLVDACNNGNMCLIKGGHDAEGNEKEKLDFKSIKKFVEVNKSKFESIAIALSLIHI